MDLSRISDRLSLLDKRYQREALSDIGRIIDRALQDQARDHALLELTAATKDRATTARHLHGAVPEFLSTSMAMRKVNVHQTTWTAYVMSGLISPVDRSAGIHQFYRHEVEELRDLSSGKRRAHVREWAAIKYRLSGNKEVTPPV